MPNKTIPGSAGTAPQTGTAPENDPTPPATPANPMTTTTTASSSGRIVSEGGKYFVIWGNNRIPIENADGLPAPAKKPVSTDATLASELQPAIDAATKNRTELLALKGVVDVRAGYLFQNGAITSIPAVVVAVKPSPGKKFDKAAIKNELGLPATLDGVPVDIEIADPFQQLLTSGEAEAIPLLRRRQKLLIDEIQATGIEAELLEAIPVITYEPPPNGDLSPVTGAMTITCHVSPDAGWKVLRPFLEGTDRKLHLGMYDFTAPHIYRTARTLLKDSTVEWQQTLGPKESLPTEDDVDSTKADDKPESSVVRGLKRVASDRFGNAFAHVGSGKTFASAYHIKVAVRDDRAFWLSSGNWQSSNQPDIDFFDANADRQLITRFNREWHVTCENALLAKRFQVFLDHDFDTAATEEEAALIPEAMPELLVPVDELLEEERAAVDLEVFAPQKFTFTSQNPLTVQPILTPDNYLEVVLEFLRNKPKRTLYFQNQSLNPILSPTPEFKELMKLLAKYSKDRDLDARFIFRNIGPIRKKIESLQAAGFNMSRVHTQSGCHTKGIIVDSETILLGSHNVTNQGVQVNRDASLLIHHEGIAKYYEKVFLHDWEKLSKPTIREESVPIAITGNEAASVVTSSEFAAVPFSYFEEE
jgi:hypothetical protein